MKTKEKLGDAVETARPYMERLARDDELHDHVRKAYDSARKIYDEVIGDRGPSPAVAMRVARDKDLQDELRKTVRELREAGRRVQGKETHTTRNVGLLMAGIAIGVLFNPATGPDTRRWIKDKLFGAEEPFEYEAGVSGESPS